MIEDRRTVYEASTNYKIATPTQLNNIYVYIIRIIKSRRMRWAGHVARMGGDEECI
jgi:hypothetical protein